MKNRIAFLIGSFIIALLIGFDLYYHMIYFLYGSKAILAYDVFTLMTSNAVNALLLSISVTISYLPLLFIKEGAIQNKMVFSFLSLSFYFILLLTLTLSHFMVRTSPYANHNVIHGYDLIIACNIILSSIINLFLIRKVINIFSKADN
ncbi:hypothetical protein CQP30_12925 [Yersinia pestis]|uniref:Membrane protein n=10 Tax=Yersinia pseudotuberculosis complex TaxID=1649845 RepID=A0AAX2HV74_YERPE|nr:hypothetical protein [Yersinia pestis]EDR33797.1 hypothetical protein YPIP275_4644 [Yersinia pestis biovar Orientalis str. IP275]EFA47630.1 conserved hypothetical protein [Yersinia pestis KIM D27]ERP78328.1 membrane protein [Yersinia pestis 24H]ERP84253.1 membrane protein [Yersinia pestis 9]AAM87641.1 hypothetical [Yersinia pestis KIM10+]